MKVLGFLAVLAAGFLGVTGGTAQAMPITLNFSGAILDPSQCGPVNANCDPILYEPSLGGIFSPGQAVTASIIYDPSSLTSAMVSPFGNTSYVNAVRDLKFEIAISGGSFAIDLTGPFPTGLAGVCGGPTCVLASGEQYIRLLDVPSSGGLPQVAGNAFIGAAFLFLNDQDLLSSNALLPAEELIPVIQQSRQLFFLSFFGTEECRPGGCIVLAEGSVSVPEPAGAGILGFGLVGLIALRRRKKASA